MGRSKSHMRMVLHPLTDEERQYMARRLDAYGSRVGFGEERRHTVLPPKHNLGPVKLGDWVLASVYFFAICLAVFTIAMAGTMFWGMR